MRPGTHAGPDGLSQLSTTCKLKNKLKLSTTLPFVDTRTFPTEGTLYPHPPPGPYRAIKQSAGEVRHTIGLLAVLGNTDI